jgi:hypothetical protein
MGKAGKAKKHRRQFDSAIGMAFGHPDGRNELLNDDVFCSTQIVATALSTKSGAARPFC